MIKSVWVKWVYCLFVVVGLFGQAARLQAQTPSPVGIELIAKHSRLAKPSDGSQVSTTIGVLFRIAPNWHIYWKNSGESAVPTKITWRLSNAWSVDEVQWPAPYHFVERGKINTYGYKDEVLLFADATAFSPEAYQGEELRISAEVEWLMCSDICVPGKAETELVIPLVAGASEYSDKQRFFEKYAALVPQDLTQATARLESTHPLRTVQVATLLSHEAVVPGENTEAVISLQGLALPLDRVAQGIQIFPDNSSFLEFTVPEVGRSKAGETIVKFRLRALKDAPLGVSVFSGIAVIDKALFTGDRNPSIADFSFSWTIPVRTQTGPVRTQTGQAEVNSAFASLVQGVEFRPTSFRTIDHSDGASPTAAAKGNNTAAGAQPAGANLLLALIFAFLGGMILNLMPCVLPIIGIKVLGFAAMGGKSAGTAKSNALAFCAGILLTFLSLAALVVVLRGFGHTLGWGFQFQYPEFVLFLALIVFVLALGFFDLYSLTLPFLSQACEVVDELKPSLGKHFFDGILATLLSTPCTAPFLGTALLYAFSQAGLVTFLVFAACGLGLATPYYFLATHPSFLSRLPKPGPWMQGLRQVMGFFLLGTVVWLLSVLHGLAGHGSLNALSLMLVLAFCLWLAGWMRRWRARDKFLGRALICLLLLSAWYFFYQGAVTRRPLAGQSAAGDQTAILWQEFSPETVRQALQEHKGVFLDFTADWCITCKANEWLVINTPEVASALRELDIVPIQADWTQGDPQITEALRQYGAQGVPLYVVIKGKNAEQANVLPTILSKKALISALNAK